MRNSSNSFWGRVYELTGMVEFLEPLDVVEVALKWVVQEDPPGESQPVVGSLRIFVLGLLPLRASGSYSPVEDRYKLGSLGCQRG